APAATALAAPDGASIDWEKRVIVAHGLGAPDLSAPNAAAARIGAERAAKLDAFRNLLEALKGVHVREGQTAASLMSRDEALRASVEGVLREFTVVERHYFSDGGVELVVSMPLDGRVGTLLVPAAGEAQVKAPEGTGSVGSGLVVVAKGLKVAPALAPRILDASGHEVYGPGFVQVASLRANGIAGYLHDVVQAVKSARVGDRPMTVHAIAARGSDLVISDADAKRLSDPASNLGFLAEGKVIIVVD
ncbi:MAG: hypothetical protein ACYCWW_12320, partial [Deltaproteobacteria bacterium]